MGDSRVAIFKLWPGSSILQRLAPSGSGEQLPATGRFGLIAYPAQKSRVCWDLFGGLLILYDLFVPPGIELFKML